MVSTTEPTSTGAMSPIMIIVFIAISDGVAHRTGYRRAMTQLDFALGRPDGAATCGPRGSPFQLPTGLADGLGLRSGLGGGSPLPFAPSGVSTPEFGSPASARRKAGRFRLQLLQLHHSFAQRQPKSTRRRPITT